MDDWLIIQKEARRRKMLSVGRRLEEVWSSRFWNSAYVGGKLVRFYFILVFVGKRERGERGKNETYSNFSQILDIRLWVHTGFGELE